MNKNDLLKEFGEYTGHLLIGTFVFLILVIVSGGATIFVHWFSHIVGDEQFSNFMASAKMIILYFDVALYMALVAYSTYKAIVKMIKE